MANVTIGNANLAQNHPRIISVVSNNAEVYQPNNGGLKMFAALISERGPEDVRVISHQNELISLYGALDIKKYGQSGYNVQNWLQAGGQAVIKRVMPDDAAYAHAFLNVRTKINGEDFYAQTLVSSIADASTEATIDNILTGSAEDGHNGYKNNLLAVFTPVGRGKSYDNIGFRMYTNRQYDNFLTYRLYNFEVVEYLTNGSVNVIEGPFSVSLYRDALSPVNNESMFIEDVLTKYSETLRVKINEEAVINVCKQICPDTTNPFIVDPLFFETRIINGTKETVNGKDVHAKLFRMNGTEVVTDRYGEPILNVYDATDEFDVERIAIEDKYARDEYSFITNSKLEIMAKFISDVEKNGTDVNIGDTTTLTHENCIRIFREVLARAEVAGDAQFTTIKTVYDNYVAGMIDYDLDTLNKEKGSALLDTFRTSYAADLKLIVNSHLTSKIAFIQNNISEALDLVFRLGVAGELESYIVPLEAVLTDLTNEYTPTAEKVEKVETLLNTDFAQVGSLGKMINDLVSGAKTALGTPTRPEIPNSPFEQAGVGSESQLAKYKANYAKAKQEIADARVLFVELEDIKAPVRLRDGSDGEFDLEIPTRDREASIERYLVNLFNGTFEPLVTSVKLCPFNFIIDANYTENVKNAIVNLATNIRRDFIFIADCGINANAKGDLAFRNKFNVSSNYVAIYGQNEVIYDSASGRDVKVTTPNILASKLPVLESTVGLQNPIAGSRRGVISGFKAINYLPTENEQEDLYNNRVNYILGDNQKYILGSQLTSDFKRTPLSDLNNVITMLNIKRAAERSVEKYQFEFLDSSTMRTMQQDINLIISNYIASNSIDSGNCTVYATEYDTMQHIVRVNISIKFKDIIETVIITLEVTR